MKKNIKTRIHPFVIMGMLLLIVTGSCKKKKDEAARPPLLTTSEITSITATGAESGGDISNDGGATVTTRGICWSTSENPTVDDDKVADTETGTGTFTASLTGLTPETKYYVRAYATNSAGTAYGNELSFTSSAPPVELPVLGTSEVTDITTTGAVSGGNVVSDGGAPVTVRGICWSTSENPTVDDDHVADSETGTGTFTASLTGLTPETKYYVRAYATNSAGTAYGDEMSFTSAAVSEFTIGMEYGGGKIFYIDNTGQHGLIVAPNDQSDKAENWETAMALCADLTLNGYDDWYLPSKDELNLLFLQKDAVGGFANYGYYSSTEESATVVWRQAFGSGKQLTGKKTNSSYVRAIRAF